MIRPLLVLILTTGYGFANSGTELLLKERSNLNLSTNYAKAMPTLNLDDTFLVQSYGALRSLRVSNLEIQDFYNLVFSKKFEAALVKKNSLKGLGPEEEKLVNAAHLYVLWKLKLNQSFFYR